jgi:dihydrofolate reductase
MRKLIESTFVSLDGDISAPQDWGPQYWNDEYWDYTNRLLFGADALLLGRVTYQGLSEAYMQMDGEFAERMNSLPKYVASNTLQDATWNATIIKGDIVNQVAELKQKPGKHLLKYGNGPLDRLLMEHRLVDEFHFWLCPVVAGSSRQHLFEAIDTTTKLKLIQTTPFKSGMVVLTYTSDS